LANIASHAILVATDSIAKEIPVPTRNINLTEHFDRFVDEQIDAGKYKNASEVLRAGLRLLEQQTQTEEQKLELLRKLAAEGFRSLDQGQGLAIASETGLRTTIATIGRRAAKTGKHRQAE
jgi:antitoxin ParD1/3/4